MSACRLDCSAPHCPSTPGQNPHCRECSHAAYYGIGQDARGRTWRWLYTLQWGPQFLRRDGQPLKRSPLDNARHPAWQAFDPWFAEHGA